MNNLNGYVLKLLHFDFQLFFLIHNINFVSFLHNTDQTSRIVK